MSNPKELGNYPFSITRRAKEDDLTPNEYVGRIIRAAIIKGNPFIKEIDSFVVMGLDSYDGRLYPCASYGSLEEARAKTIELQREEAMYADLVNSFYIFTCEGNTVPIKDSKSAQS